MKRKKCGEVKMPFLMSLLIIVAVIFLIALISFMKGFFIFGLPYLTLNIIILLLSLITMMKVAWYIVFY